MTRLAARLSQAERLNLKLRGRKDSSNILLLLASDAWLSVGFQSREQENWGKEFCRPPFVPILLALLVVPADTHVKRVDFLEDVMMLYNFLQSMLSLLSCSSIMKS